MGEVIVMDKLYPEWKAKSVKLTLAQFGADIRVSSEFIDVHLSRALSLDAKRSSHPIEVPIYEAETINQVCSALYICSLMMTAAKIFDALSYSKAASSACQKVAEYGR